MNNIHPLINNEMLSLFCVTFFTLLILVGFLGILYRILIGIFYKIRKSKKLNKDISIFYSASLKNQNQKPFFHFELKGLNQTKDYIKNNYYGQKIDFDLIYKTLTEELKETGMFLGSDGTLTGKKLEDGSLKIGIESQDQNQFLYFKIG